MLLQLASCMSAHHRCNSNICNCCSLRLKQRQADPAACPSRSLWRFGLLAQSQTEPAAGHGLFDWQQSAAAGEGEQLSAKEVQQRRHESCYPEGCAAPSFVPCQCNTREPLSKLERTSPRRKIIVTSKSPVGDISVVTLIRTDTTLDHSQKAEKV